MYKTKCLEVHQRRKPYLVVAAESYPCDAPASIS